MYHFHSYWFDRFKDLEKVDKKNPFWYNKEKESLMDIIQKMYVDDTLHVSISMEKYLEKSKYLMALCQDNDITIQRYYWKSFNNVIEYIQPKIVDAFIMVIDIHGDKDKIEYVLSQYKKVFKSLERLQYIQPLSEKEIKEIAIKFLQSCFI